MTYRLLSFTLALAVLATVLTAFFSPFLLVHAEENPAPETTQTTGGNSFVPLTSLPGIDEVTGADSIASFLNQLYRLSIGAAAVLAVLQIIRAGLMYMTEESISEKKEARHLITMAILGLVLVLSPAIVFGVIDPRILDLSIDLQGIQPSATSNSVPQGSVGDALSTGNGITAGTRLSCLYPRQAPDAVAGLQGNRPATVVEDESATEGRAINDGNNLLRVRFDEDPNTERYVAAGDCHEIVTHAEPAPEVRELGGFRVGQMIYCPIGTSNPAQPYRRVNVTSIVNGTHLALSCEGCMRVLVTPDQCSREIPPNVCGTPPSCNASCTISSDYEGNEACEPI